MTLYSSLTTGFGAAAKAGAPSRRKAVLREVAIIGAILALTVLVHGPFFGNIDDDEAFFALVGRDWLHGALPYAARFDVKPPGLFALYALAQFVAGASVASFKGLVIFAVAASSYGLLLIGRKHFSPRVGYAAAALYPFYSLAMQGVNVPVALLLNGFEIFGALAALAVSGGRMRHALASGALFGCAFMVKQSAAFDAAGVMVAIVFTPMAAGKRVSRAAAFVLGGAVAPLGFAAYYLAHGDFLALWTAVIVDAAGRLGGDNVTFVAGVLRFPGGLKPALVLMTGAMLVVLRRSRLDARLEAGVLAGVLLGVGRRAGRSGHALRLSSLFPAAGSAPAAVGRGGP